MSLEEWFGNGWLRRHSPTRQEMEGLFSIVDRDLKDASKRGISPDWRFGIAYNAALKLCTVLVHASGYRPEKALQHYARLPHCHSSWETQGRRMLTISNSVGSNATPSSTSWPAPLRTRMPRSF